jgi:uncharacterized protein
MLIRFVLENVYSFLESKEFNMLPRPKLRIPEGHKYHLDGIDLLKMAALFGANAAGKSNLIKAMGLLQDLAKGKISSKKVYDARFKFDSSIPFNQLLAIEFVQEGSAYYYALALSDGKIQTEELYQSGLGKKKDELIFERKLNEEGSAQLTFSDAFEKDPKSQALKSILIEEFLDDSKTLLPFLAKRNNPYLSEVKTAMQWFDDTLKIITPIQKPIANIQYGFQENRSLSFAQETISAFGVGISKIEVEEKPIEELIGKDNDAALLAIQDKLRAEKQDFLTLRNANGDELVVEKKEGKLVSKQLRITQSDLDGEEVEFDISELSDGTIRLLEFLPAFQDVVLKRKVYMVDEIERSLHPNLAKELVKKFSQDPQTRGQLIFSTHESNLLDLSIFRQDEIWFAEKGPDRSTDLYSLSDFKEHHTTDIRKGYLNGRYGAVPSLMDLQELNWQDYAAE